MPSVEAGTSSLGSTPDLGFNLEELTPESLPEQRAEGPTPLGAKRSQKPSEPRTPGSASPMGKRSKDPSTRETVPDPVKDPKGWLNYMRAEHPVIPHWWEELVEAKKGVPQGNQVEQAQDLANQVFQTFRLPGAQVHAGGRPGVINVPSSLGALIRGAEGSIGYRDVRRANLVD